MVKYKIHELAKDFNISSKDVIALLAEKLGVEKKSQTSLEEEELDLVFECVLAEHISSAYASTQVSMRLVSSVRHSTRMAR